MLKFWTPAIAVCLCVQLLGISAAQLRDATLDQLIAQLSDDEVERRRDAVYEFVRRGDKSDAALAALGKATKDVDAQIRVQSLTGLARAGKSAESAIQELLECLGDRDPQVRYRAAGALGAIGHTALEPLMSHWTSASNDSKIAAAQALAILGPQASSAKPLLVEALGGKDALGGTDARGGRDARSGRDARGGSDELPRYAAEALVAIVPQDEAELLKLADHADAVVRKIGISGLSALVSPSAKAMLRLQSAASDPDPQIRERTIIMVAKSKLPVAEKSDLIEAALLDSVASVRAAAVVAMLKAALPAEEFAAKIATRLPSVELGVANGIVKALATLGPSARGALPALVAAANRDGIDQQLLSQTLASFGAQVVPDLLAAIEQQPASEPVFSQALGLIGEPAVTALTLGLSSDVELVRLAATRALGSVRPSNRALIEKLAAAVKDKSAQVRAVAVTSLIAAGKEADFAKELIFQATQDAEPEVRSAALQSLRSFEFTDEQAQAAVEQGLIDASAEVRSSALIVLSETARLLNSRSDQLAAMVKDADSQVRAKAAQTLGKLDKKQINENVINACVAALGDDDIAVRVAATESVRSLGISDPAVLKALGGNLADDLTLLRATLEAMSDVGEQAASMSSVVAHLATHEKAEVRAAALNCLAAIEKDRSQLVARLIDALDDKEWEVRRVAGVALGKLGPDAKNAVPKLFQLLSSEEDRDFASSSLKEINTAPVEAVGLLIEKLDSEERRTAFYAVSLLGKIGPPAAEALPKLEAMLAKPSDDPGRSEFRRKFLTEAIAAIKGETKPDK